MRERAGDMTRSAPDPSDANGPKYLTIAQELVHAIRTGALQAGARIPSENDIIVTHQVSNTTARRALNWLETRGWIRRRRGSGSYVDPRCVDLSLDRILDFSTSAHLASTTPSTRLLDVRFAEETPLMRIAGEAYAIEGLVCRIERLCLADDVPVMLERRYVSATVCPDLDAHDLTGSLFELYERTYGLVLAEARQDLSVVTLDSGETMDLFELDRPIGALRIQGATLTADGRLVELEDAFYRSDRYRFSVVARR